MTNLNLDSIYDARNMGQLEDGYPMIVKVRCFDDKGAKYEGWFYPTDDMRCYLKSDGTWIVSDRAFYFYQSQLPSGKTCSRKVSTKVSKAILDLAVANLSKVEDYSIRWNQIKSERTEEQQARRTEVILEAQRNTWAKRH
tara:strand:- start:9 stop:428 length:420 start_codon:yes stop_codon:yes gene_type:complete